MQGQWGMSACRWTASALQAGQHSSNISRLCSVSTSFNSAMHEEPQTAHARAYLHQQDSVPAPQVSHLSRHGALVHQQQRHAVLLNNKLSSRMMGDTAAVVVAVVVVVAAVVRQGGRGCSLVW